MNCFLAFTKGLTNQHLSSCVNINQLYLYTADEVVLIIKIDYGDSLPILYIKIKE